MSKERARRREEREREAAAQAAARAETERRTARRRALLDRLAGPFRRARLSLTTGKQTGALARRRSTRLRLILVALFLFQVLVWVARPDWEARLGAFVIAVFVFPVAAVFVL